MRAGDLEAGLLSGLGGSRRNKMLRKLLAQGRPEPTGFRIERHDDGRITCAPHHEHESGHRWHGHCIVELLIAQRGTAALQVCLLPISALVSKSPLERMNGW